MTTTTTDPLAAAVRAHTSQVLTTTDLACLRAARCQFEAPRVAPDEVKVPNRSGSHPDPTFDIATDPRRLRVRAAYLGTVAAFEQASAILQAAEADLRESLIAFGEDADEFPERPADPVGILPVAA
ncbi:hypothetical protein CH252_32955 [Rhodococcus sp. 06-1477-1B]|nr:hypothetical protein CH252_32955 [Rhodococcus sp. 06-1477-1B]